MNAPYPIGQSHNVPASRPSAVPVHPLAGAAGSPSFPCRECNGAGEAEYMGLCEDRYHWRRCHVCEGSRVEAPYCNTCGETLKADLFCVSCDDYASLVYVERISPTRIAL